jgi:hypothetical protein
VQIALNAGVTMNRVNTPPVCAAREKHSNEGICLKSFQDKRSLNRAQRLHQNSFDAYGNATPPLMDF